MKKYLPVFVIGCLLLTGCADVEHVNDCVQSEPYGFWSGLWHGIISPFSFIGSLFNESIAMYAVNNSGSLYDLGFVLGSGILFRGFWESLSDD
jgi:hypothetical protein